MDRQIINANKQDVMDVALKILAIAKNSKGNMGGVNAVGNMTKIAIEIENILPAMKANLKKERSEIRRAKKCVYEAKDAAMSIRRDNVKRAELWVMRLIDVLEGFIKEWRVDPYPI